MSKSVDREFTLQLWGWIFLISGILGLVILLGIGAPTSNYGDDSHWNMFYVSIGIATLVQGFIFKLLLGGIAEIIRVNRIGPLVAQELSVIDCPACAETIKAKALICSHCRYAIHKHSWVLDLRGEWSNCPYCRGSVKITDEQFDAGVLDCPYCKRNYRIKKGDQA